MNKKQIDAEETFSQLQSDMERAKAAQKRRMTAPEITMATADEIPQEVMLKLYCPECDVRRAPTGEVIRDPKTGQPAMGDWHAFIGDSNKHDLYLDQGYEPVVRDGKHVKTEGGDPVYRIPMKLYQRKLNEDVLRDRKMQRGNVKEDEATLAAAGKGTHTKVKEEEFSSQRIAVDGTALAEAIKGKTEVG